MTQSKKPVALLGATGMVGQMAAALLEHHPELTLSEIVASDKKVGQTYTQSCTWSLDRPCPKNLAGMKLMRFEDITSSLVLSALPKEAALEKEKKLAQKGHFVISNASAYRMDKNTPLLIPEVNADSLKLLAQQETPGKIVTNPNCAVIVLCLALRPLLDLGELTEINVATLQALSGAGLSGPLAYNMVGDIMPFIAGEEDKFAPELAKIMGIDVPLNVTCHRVNVAHGHTLALHLNFNKDISLEKVAKAFGQCPEIVYLGEDAPRPRHHLQWDDMNIYIGRVRHGARKNTLLLSATGHNLVRGAAGAALANASLVASSESFSC